MADEFSAIDPEASVGAIPTSRACWAELDAKQPSAQGTDTSAASSRLVPSGQTSRLSAIDAIAIITARCAPMRSMFLDISMLPMKPNAPNQTNSRLSCTGVMSIVCL